MNEMRTYFDMAATTPCVDPALEQIELFNKQCFGNPSSSCRQGAKGAEAIANARFFFADYFGVPPEQVIFTGSGTEANNLAIYGTLLPFLYQKRPQEPVRALCSAVEHSAVRNCIESLRELGFEIESVKVNSDGSINLEDLKNKTTPQTKLVSIMRVNNITGAMFSVEELASIVKEKSPEALFHSDCIQAFGKTQIPRFPSTVDLLSISAHKIGGPKGVGALVLLNPSLLRNKRLRPLIWGGGQESGYRSGTQSPALISAFHLAAQQVLQNLEKNMEHCIQLRDVFETAVEEDPLLQGQFQIHTPAKGIPNIVSLSAPSIPVSAYVRILEEEGFVISTGSACSSSSGGYESVLKEMGLTENHYRAALRVSFSAEHTRNDVEALTSAMKRALVRLKTLLGKPIR